MLKFRLLNFINPNSKLKIAVRPLSKLNFNNFDLLQINSHLQNSKIVRLNSYHVTSPLHVSIDSFSSSFFEKVSFSSIVAENNI